MSLPIAWTTRKLNSNPDDDLDTTAKTGGLPNHLGIFPQLFSDYHDLDICK